MKKISFIIKTIFIILLFNSYSFAVVSIPTPSVALNQIATSMSHSANNTVQTTTTINNTTSNLLDSSELTVDIQKNAKKLGLSLDKESATILASTDSTDAKSVSKAMGQVKENVTGRDEDYVPTLNQDTIVYETEWFALEKVGTQAGSNPSTMNSFDYASTHDVFKEGAEQTVKGKVYVNFKKRDMWAEMDVKLTLTQATSVASAGEQQTINYESGTATFSEVPVVADEVIRYTHNGDQWGNVMSAEGNTLKASATALRDACSNCDWWKTKSQMVSEWNHDNNSGAQDAWKSVHIYGKFTTASEGGTALGQVAIEGGHHDDNSEEAAFVASIERYEASGAITGKAYEGN